MSGIDRRSFLLSLLALSAAASGGLFLFNRRHRRPDDPATFVADLVRERLSHLDLDDEDLMRFGQDFADRGDPGQQFQIRRLLETRDASPSLRLEREIVSCFLRGSDFFDRGGEPSTARYVAFPDPYEIGCANPLARLARDL